MTRIEKNIKLSAALVAFAIAFSGVATAQTSSTDLSITVGKSVAIDYPSDIGRISTSNPEIVDAVAVSTREILLHAKGLGISTVIVWSKSGDRAFYNITVDHNLEPIRRILKETFPDEAIEVRSARDSVTLIGKVSTLAISERVSALVATLSRAVTNNLQVADAPAEKQILLRVKFAEVSRAVGTQLGANLVSTGALNTIGSISTGQFSSPTARSIGEDSNFSLSDALNIFMFRPDLNLATTIKALQSTGVLQILAEPNLMATNGKEASFLAGGEFPVPILQGSGSQATVTVSYREFGIRVNFTPVLTAHNTLKMHVKPEVSTLDFGNAVTLSGFVIPALGTRRIETDVELALGQSFVIGGLMDDRTTDSMSKVPWLSSVPVLGSFFKSKETRKNKTELIVMVTPELVTPFNPGDAKPMPVMPTPFLPPAVPDAKRTGSRSGDDLQKDKGGAKENARNQKQEKVAPTTVAGVTVVPVADSINISAVVAEPVVPPAAAELPPAGL